MRKVGIFYGPKAGNVEKVAHLIAAQFGENQVDLIAVRDADEHVINQYDHIVFGLSTIGKTNWDSELKNTDWDLFFTKLKYADWEDKRVAIFGLGDQVQYPYHFVDAMGWLYDLLKGLRVTVVGHCSAEEYDFKESEALRDGKFVGLPVDEDFEQELTLRRVKEWVDTVKKEFAL